MSSSLSVKALPNKDFDYSNLDAETLHFVQKQTGEIRSLMKRTAQDIIKIGQKLIAVKKRLGYGQYRKWIKTEFNWGKSTANSFENVAKQFADVQNLDIFAPSALYELAAPSTPKSAREEAIARAQAGEKIGCKFAREIKKKHITELAKPKSGQTVKMFEEADRYASSSNKQPVPLKKSQHNQNNPGEEEKKSFPVSVTLPSQQLEQKRKEKSITKQKVIAIYPKQAKLNSHVSSETTKTHLLSLTDSTTIIQPESWWQLGKHHLMYCGDPHSPKLQTQLPKRIALAISFPPTANWYLGSLEQKVNSSLVLFSQYKDVDLKALRDIVRNALTIYTSAEETVMFSFLPDPALLLVAEKLFCRCWIAEPDIERCQAVIQAWTRTGGTVTMKKSF